MAWRHQDYFHPSSNDRHLRYPRTYLSITDSRIPTAPKLYHVYGLASPHLSSSSIPQPSYRRLRRLIYRESIPEVLVAQLCWDFPAFAFSWLPPPLNQIMDGGAVLKLIYETPTRIPEVLVL